MMCLLKLEPGKFDVVPGGEITGWFIGHDAHDVRRQLDWQNAEQLAVANELYRREFFPPGKHPMPNGYVLLVSP